MAKTIGNRNLYATTRQWLCSELYGQDVVVCEISALECLGFFCGYLSESVIDVYALSTGSVSGINYNVVDSFDEMDIIDIDGLRCTSFNQTVNDILAKIDEIDEQPLVEALNEYYFSNQQSFDGLSIAPGNQVAFESLKGWIFEYYNGGR